MKGKPFALVGVNINCHDPKTLKGVMAKEQLNFRSFTDTAAGEGLGVIGSAWNLFGTPTVFVLDHKGVTIDNSGNRTAGDLIWRLNQQIKGWTMYHRFVVSQRTFAAVDHRIYWKLRRWCRKRHRNKSWKWIKKKYFQPAGNRSGVFSGVIRDSKGKSWPIQLMAAAGVKTLRWVKIRSEANPYDPAWEMYLEERAAWKLGHTLAGRDRIGYLWKEQGGKCARCGQRLQEEEQPWHRHHRVWRCHGGRDTFDNLELLHANCHRQLHAGKRH